MSERIALAVQALEGAAELLDQESALRLIGVYARRLTPPGDAPGATITRGQAAALDDCAEVYVPVTQWTTADSEVRGVWMRAPRFRDCMLAERAATTRDAKTGESTIDEWRQIAEELAACITRPKVAVDTLLDWNAEVVYALHRRLRQLAPLPGALVAAELARLAGGPPPPQPPAPAALHAVAGPDRRPVAGVPPGDAGAEPAADGVGGDDRPAPGAAADPG